MKIVLANKFYYPRGGDCVVAMEIEKMLHAQGHQIAIFAMQYPENMQAHSERYFPEEVSFAAKGIGNKIKAAYRVFGDGEVARKFTQLILHFQPDVVHLHNIHSYLSPIIAQIAHRKGIKVVWTLHDYKLVCPAYSFLRQGKVCELCLENNVHVLTKKCMKNSYTASLLAYLEAQRWNKKTLIAATDNFICPSEFMAQKMREGGFPDSKLTVLNNFVSLDDITTPLISPQRESAYCYIGRLSVEKGVGNLLAVASTLPYPLYIAGDGPLKEKLQQQYASHTIRFLGKLSRQEVKKLLQKVKFSVIPSICYENNPLGVIESLCLGTPVLGANIGGIPELIDKKTGRLFQYDSLHDLSEKLSGMFQHLFNHQVISRQALSRFSKENYYDILLKTYQKK